MNDSQQQAVYAAEDAVLGAIGPRLRRWTQVESFLRAVLTSPDYESAFPNAPLDIELQRRARSATASLAVAATDLIVIRDGSWNAVTVLHELAHLVAPGDPAHGPAFVATELELVRRSCGFDAYATLRTSFLEHGVDIGEPASPGAPSSDEPPVGTLSPEGRHG